MLSDSHQVWGWSQSSKSAVLCHHGQHIDGEMLEVSLARMKLKINTRMMVTLLTLLLASSVQAADLEIRIPNDELSQQDGYYRLDYRSVTRLPSSTVTPP